MPVSVIIRNATIGQRVTQAITATQILEEHCDFVDPRNEGNLCNTLGAFRS